MEDPDVPGGGFLHWLVTGIDPTSMVMPPGIMPPGAAPSKNDKGVTGYWAPCATDGGHRYMFHVYALDTALPAGVVKDVFFGAIEKHLLAHGTLLGTYGRPDPFQTVGDVTSDARKRVKVPTPKS